MTAGRLTPLTTGLPEPVSHLLHQAQMADQAARGPERRPALAFTRAVIGGIRATGYPVATIAKCLGVSASAVRDRTSVGAWLAADRLQATLGLGSPAGRLVRRKLGPPDPAMAGYPAVDVVRILIASADELIDRRIQGDET
jgi:hypothetical protein